MQSFPNIGNCNVFKPRKQIGNQIEDECKDTLERIEYFEKHLAEFPPSLAYEQVGNPCTEFSKTRKSLNKFFFNSPQSTCIGRKEAFDGVDDLLKELRERFPDIRSLDSFYNFFDGIPKIADSFSKRLEQFRILDSAPNSLETLPQESNRISQPLNNRLEESDDCIHAILERLALFKRLILSDNPIGNLGQNICKDVTKRLQGRNQLHYAIFDSRKRLLHDINRRSKTLNDFGQLFIDRQTGIGGFGGLVGRTRNLFNALRRLIRGRRCFVDRGFNIIRSIPVSIPCRQISSAPGLAIRIVSFFAFLDSGLRCAVQLVISVVLLCDQVNRNSELCCLILCPCVEVELSGPVANDREIDFAILIRPLLHPVRHGFVDLFGFFGIRFCRRSEHIIFGRSAVRSCHSIKCFLNRNLELSDETESLLDSEREVFKPLRQLNQPLPRHRRNNRLKRPVGDVCDRRDNIIEILKCTEQAGTSAVFIPEFQNLISGFSASSKYIPEYFGDLRPEFNRLV